MSESMDNSLPTHAFGRVDADNTVFVTDQGVERQVGQYPDGTPEEALAYFVRKFDDLAGQVTLLEQRVRAGANSNDVAKSATQLRRQLDGANAVGDLASLRNRLEQLGGEVEALSGQQAEAQKEAVTAAIAQREEIVAAAEGLAAQPAASIQWKQTQAKMEDLFNQWQEHQRTGVRIPKNEANALWKRFRTARTTLDVERRKFYANLDAQHKGAREAKEHLIERADALTSKGADGVAEYRRLVDEWKTVGRAGRKHDDALWQRFRQAGDVIFAAKSEVDARDDEAYRENLDAKLALLDEAAPIMELNDRKQARDRLRSVQQRWDEIGRVPRDRFKEVEDRLRTIEQHVRSLEDHHWRDTNPERKARSAGMSAQLTDAIAGLEEQLAQAKESGDVAAITALEAELVTKRGWLDAIGG